MTLTRTIKIRPAYDKRVEGCGIHGADMVFTLGNEQGYVTWTLFTGWHLPQTREGGTIKRYPFEYWRSPQPANFDYHSPKRLHEWETPLNCHLLGTCYSDGTSCTEDLFKILIAKGTDGLWAELEARWAVLFNKEVEA